MFPFGVHPEPDDDAEASRDDARGPDTANRILLHGARHHDRDAVFLRWGQGRRGWEWQLTPDWRADRASIRAGLVLRERLGVAEGERVAIWLPLGPEWAEIERGVWSIGAVSVPIWPDRPLGRVASVLADSSPDVLFTPSLAAVRELEAIGGRPEGVRAIVPLEAPEEQGDDWLSLAKFLEYGGVRDTPERASMWRTYARGVGPDAPASLEYDDGPDGVPGEAGAGAPCEVSQGELVAWAERIARRFPARKGGTRLLATDRPDLISRVLIVAGWADGLTRTAFAPSRVGRERAGQLGVDVVAARGSEAGALLGSLTGSGAARVAGSGEDESAARPALRLLGRLRRAAADGSDAAASPPRLLSIDGTRPEDEDAAGTYGDVVDAAELLGAPGGSPEDEAGPDGLEKHAGSV